MTELLTLKSSNNRQRTSLNIVCLQCFHLLAPPSRLTLLVIKNGNQV